MLKWYLKNWNYIENPLLKQFRYHGQQYIITKLETFSENKQWYVYIRTEEIPIPHLHNIEKKVQPLQHPL